jgi:hypothetical protein
LSYSLKELSAGVTLAAVAAGAVIYPSHLWAVSLFTATVVFIAMSGLAAVMSRPRRCPFLTGFFALGLVFLLLCYGPDWLRGRLAVNLIPNYAALRWALHLEESYRPQVPAAQVARVFPVNPPDAQAVWQIYQNGVGRTVATPLPPDLAVLTEIADSLFVLFVAVLGGMVARYCHRHAAQPKATA